MSTEPEAPVIIAPYDPSWPAAFLEERARLAQVLREWLAGPIEHVGSTAIAGLVAKPVIDIMAAVASLDASRPAIRALAALDYKYFPYRPDIEHWFCKPSLQFRTHHLHLIPFGSRSWIDTLAFRDYLRDHPEVAAEYGSLKRALAKAHQFDREAYTEAKAPFIARILRDATS